MTLVFTIANPFLIATNRGIVITNRSPCDVTRPHISTGPNTISTISTAIIIIPIIAMASSNTTVIMVRCKPAAPSTTVKMTTMATTPSFSYHRYPKHT
jgi:hypothetical protein